MQRNGNQLRGLPLAGLMNRFFDVAPQPDRSIPRAPCAADSIGPRGGIRYDLAEEVDRLAARVDWEAALPARAHGASWRAQQLAKRVVDIVGATTGLIMLLPLFAIIVVVVIIDSSGNPFYPWRVVGYRGRRFTSYKFRT